MGCEAALLLQDVVFRYQKNGKRNILDHVNLEIAAGTVTVLMGPSGCGKSTLAALAAGLYPENGGYLESGCIRLFGEDVTGLNPQKRAAKMTILFQNAGLQFCMDTLRKEMQFCMENICIPPEEMDRRAKEAAEALGVTQLLDRKLHTLSGGEQQKAALCCLYVMESKCILLDEAFANLDSSTIDSIMPLLRRLRDSGRTIIAIDHQLGHWLELADEIIVLGPGAAVAARGIHAGNLKEYFPLFEQHGLLYPKRRTRQDAARFGSVNAVELRSVSIPRGKPKKGLFGRKEKTENLLENADAAFPAGCMTAVLGRSGTGKTTTFLSVLRQHPHEGQILIDGTDNRRMPVKEIFRKIGIVFQNPGNQFVTQQAEQEAMQSIRLWHPAITEEEARKKADAMLEEYGLLTHRRYSPYMLSQGQQRRLAVLSVLAGGQKIIFLDEPTYGQDYRSTTAIMHQLKSRVQEEGLTVVFITHDVELARVWADKAYILRDRKLIETPPEALEAGLQ